MYTIKPSFLEQQIVTLNKTWLIRIAFGHGSRVEGLIIAEFEDLWYRRMGLNTRIYLDKLSPGLNPGLNSLL